MRKLRTENAIFAANSYRIKSFGPGGWKVSVWWAEFDLVEFNSTGIVSICASVTQEKVLK